MLAETMTLIVSEIVYNPGKAEESRILCAADRRIIAGDETKPDRRKLFKSDRLNATASYFGLAEIPRKKSFEQILRDFVRDDQSETIEAFAASLREHLNTIVPKDLLRGYPSGLHVCGFTERGVPQFWFIRNIERMDGFAYAGFKDSYWMSEELSQVHVTHIYNPDTETHSEPFRAWFANGDLRTHGPAWEMFDMFAALMDARGLAKPPSSAAEFEKRLRWKFEAIGRYYDIVADQPLVGGGTDTFILAPGPEVNRP